MCELCKHCRRMLCLIVPEVDNGQDKRSKLEAALNPQQRSLDGIRAADIVQSSGLQHQVLWAAAFRKLWLRHRARSRIKT